MNPSEIANHLGSWVNHKYPTGIGWISRERNILTVEWVDGSTDEITVVAHHKNAGD